MGSEGKETGWEGRGAMAQDVNRLLKVAGESGCERARHEEKNTGRRHRDGSRFLQPRRGGPLGVGFGPALAWWA